MSRGELDPNAIALGKVSREDPLGQRAHVVCATFLPGVFSAVEALPVPFIIRPFSNWPMYSRPLR